MFLGTCLWHHVFSQLQTGRPQTRLLKKLFILKYTLNANKSQIYLLIFFVDLLKRLFLHFIIGSPKVIIVLQKKIVIQILMNNWRKNNQNLNINLKQHLQYISYIVTEITKNNIFHGKATSHYVYVIFLSGTFVGLFISCYMIQLICIKNQFKSQITQHKVSHIRKF